MMLNVTCTIITILGLTCDNRPSQMRLGARAEGGLLINRCGWCKEYLQSVALELDGMLRSSTSIFYIFILTRVPKTDLP